MKQQVLEHRARVASLDGKLAFVLKRSMAGVHVERQQRVENAPQTGLVTMHIFFETSLKFGRFCEEDALRFEYPLVYVQARRTFDELIYVSH
jgi:hypothetical protein